MTSLAGRMADFQPQRIGHVDLGPVVKEAAWLHEMRGPNGEWVRVAAADLVVHRDGTVGHKNLPGQVGSLTHEDGKWVAHHAEGKPSRHGSRPAALREIAARHNKQTLPAPAGPEHVPEPSPAEPKPAAPHSDWITGGRVPIYTGPEVTEGDTITRPDGREGTVRMVDPDPDYGTISVDRGNPYSAIEAYHYDPGGTRTRTHTEALSDQAENAATLNSGDYLDQSDPAAHALVDGITFWTTGGNDPSWDDSFPADIALAAAVDQAPSNAPDLYRGLYGSADESPDLAHLADAKPGFRFHTGMASWSASEDVGRMFAGALDDTTGGVTGRDWGPDATKVLLQADPAAKALSVEKYAAEYQNQREWVTGGDFEVTGVTTEPGGLVVVKVRQVPDGV